MIYLYIYIALFVGTLSYAVYDSHKKVKNIPFHDGKNFLGIKTKDPGWFLVFVSAVVAPVIVFILIAGGCYRLYYRNRPRPVSKNIRKHMKVDTVMDETNTTVSLAEYNFRHGTSFTLADVYGKKYVKSLSPEDLASIREYGDTLDIENDAKSDEYFDIVSCYASARKSNDYSEFAKYLTSETVLTRFAKGRTYGREEIVEYFKRMFNNRKEAKEATKYEVLLCPYYAHAAVKELGSNFILYTLFLIEDNKVKHITITPMDEHWGIGYSPLTRPTYEADMLTILEGREVNPKEYHFSCPKCGKLSEDLHWKRVEIPSGIHGYIGDMSICPDCGCEVEFFPEIRARYEEPQFLESNKKKSNEAPFFPRIDVSRFYFDEVLKETSYWKDLDENFIIQPYVLDTKSKPMSLQECARVCHPIFLRRLYEQDKEQFAKLKACYQKAFDDGLLEAINNLAILALNYEDKEEEGMRLWRKGMELGLDSCVRNYFIHLWGKERYAEATTVLRRHDKVLFCAYNLAVLYYFGKAFKGYYLSENKEKARNYLEAIVSEGEYDEFDKGVAVRAQLFLDRFDELSNWSEYGSRLYSDLRFKVEDHKYHFGHMFENGDFFEGIHWPKNYKLAFMLPEEKGMGGETKISLYDGKANKEVEKIFDMMSVEKSEKGAFETYLLYRAKTVLPVFWHGGYIVRRYIFFREDLTKIDEMDGIDLSKFTYDLMPEVSIEGNVATVKCTWWNDWRGLVRETFTFTWDGDKATDIKSEEKVLVAYDCKICF